MALGISVQLLILVTFAWLLIAPIHGQLDSLGFISIDCGIPENSSYSDQSSSGLLYVSDFGFIDVGLNGKVNPPYNKRDMADRYITVRYFPDGTRNCYTLQPLVPARKYLVRATFYYGNYDGLNMFPVFDLYLGVNHWTTVNITTAGRAYVLEMVAVSPADYIQVCLVNTGLGTPFISGLDLRPLKAELYPEATANRSLSLLNFFRPSVANFGFNRYQFWGPIAPIYRYPYDSYHRIWQRYDNPAWTNLTKSQAVQTSNITNFDVPSLIMRSATTPLNGTQIAFSWSSDPSINNGNTTYLLLLYFAELQQLPSNALRQFDILVDNATGNGSQHYTPKYLSAEAVSRLVHGSSQHSVSLVATPNATLPPILNAFEIYSVQQLTGYMTNIRDAKAMMTVRMKFGVKRNWMGDPCAPKVFSWDGLNCSNSSSGSTWITALNLSSSGLTGAIDASFGDLKSLQYLNLSNNNLSGPIPDFLAQMPSLKFLDLSSNKLSGSIPAVLLQKSQNGSLSLRFSNNANLCGSGTSTCKHKTTIIVIATVVLVAIATLMFIAAVLFLHRMRNKQASQMVHNPMPKSPRDKSTIFDNRQFTYKELKLMTDNFREEIGQGGFGTVFLGHLEDGTTPVAVKICSRKTLQGDKEFSAEAQHLGRVHHKNLVSLIGYCKDKKHLGLVYEFMHGGNLEDRLRCISTTTSSSEASIVAPLNWHQRLKIALDSAQGLEYLHKSCQPPLIHRDVKTRNILLSAALEAKIADFGLTRALTGGELATHVTTQPAGTLGYLDPEYYNTSRLSEKSDVYSFGVVLLELLTGLPASVPVSATERIHVAQWTRQRLAEGSGIESVVDPRMGEHYDINSAWKVAELALRCKELPSRDRPTMADVVAELRESLELEASFGAVTGSSTEATDMSAVGDDQWWRHGVGAGAGNLDELNVADAEQVGHDAAPVTHVGPAPR